MQKIFLESILHFVVAFIVLSIIFFFFYKYYFVNTRVIGIICTNIFHSSNLAHLSNIPLGDLQACREIYESLQFIMIIL